MRENKQKKKQFSFEITDELLRLFNSKLGMRGEKGVHVLTDFVENYVSDAQHQTDTLTCPVCKSALAATATGVEIISVAHEFEMVAAPAALHDAVVEFLRFATNPLPADRDWRDMMLALFEKRAKARNAARR